jgi:hypothetical protein
MTQLKKQIVQNRWCMTAPDMLYDRPYEHVPALGINLPSSFLADGFGERASIGRHRMLSSSRVLQP